MIYNIYTKECLESMIIYCSEGEVLTLTEYLRDRKLNELLGID